MDQSQRSGGEHFDLLRMSAALLVFAGHHQALRGLPEPVFLGFMTWGGVGVATFFALSGYLVSESWRRDPHVGRYLARRALRLMPALVAVVLLSVFVLGPFLTTLSLADYFSHPQTWDYLHNMALGIRFALPGVFEGLPAASVTNGSLWTLPMEVACYFGVAIVLIGGVRRFHGWAIWVLACLLWLADALLPRDAVWVWYATNWRIALHFSTYFAFGAALRLAPPPRLQPIAAAVMAAVALMFFANSPIGYALSSVCVPLLVVGIARVSAAPSRWLSAKGDLSYGAYLYAFPIQQSVLWFGLGVLNGTTIFLVSLGLTLLAAWLSWHLVEAPVLRWKPKAVAARSCPGSMH